MMGRYTRAAKMSPFLTFRGSEIVANKHETLTDEYKRAAAAA